MSSVPRPARIAMAACGIAAVVIAIILLIVAGVMTLSSHKGPQPTDSAYDTTTTVAPETTVGKSQPPSTGTAIDVAVDEEQEASPQEPSGSGAASSVQKGGNHSSQPPASGSRTVTSQKVGNCQPVGCNGGKGDNYTPDIDAPHGSHTVGSGPGGTAKTAPNQSGQTVDLNN